MRQAKVIQHVSFEDLGTLEKALNHRGYFIEFIDATTTDLTRSEIKECDLLVILGGPLSVNDREEFPFLNRELDILQYRREKQLPTLGICLGAQLMAVALGGRVGPGTMPEIGWYPLTLTLAGEHSPLYPLCASKTSVFHWHGETFTLPETTTLLASSEICPNQAFSWGKNWLALQFHPEIIPQKLERWYVGHIHELNALKRNVNDLRAESYLKGPALMHQAVELWLFWLDQLEYR